VLLQGLNFEKKCVVGVYVDQRAEAETDQSNFSIKPSRGSFLFYFEKGVELIFALSENQEKMGLFKYINLGESPLKAELSFFL